jgi:hypothetical protein
MRVPTGGNDVAVLRQRGQVEMSREIALCSVVTEAVLQEFSILKFSFELFHGRDYRWFVRCDRASLPVLSQDPRITCRVFTEREANRPSEESEAFRRIVAEKMNVLGDAWADSTWQGVAFMDADIIVTAPIIPALLAVEGQVLLAPNYYPKRNNVTDTHGEYNSGFLFTRTKRFHEWWRNAFEGDPSRWTDQACLNDAAAEFEIGTLGEEVNVGFWRSKDAPQYNDIPPACLCLHVHLYQALHTRRQLVDKSFALHCLKFLHASPNDKHHRLLREIVRRDRHRWFEATLRLCDLWPAARATRRSVRAASAGKELAPAWRESHS